MTTSKLEMSLDEIIDAQKRKGQSAIKKPAGGKGNVGKGFNTKKRLQRSRVSKFNRKPAASGRAIRYGNKNKLRNNRQRRVGVIKRQAFASVNKARIQKNRSVVSVAKNLVKKLVKKAIAQNMPILPVAVSPSKRRIRVRGNRPRRNTILNRINKNSSTIGRQRIMTTFQNSPILSAKNRVPIRFNTQLPAFQLTASAPSRIITTPQQIILKPQSSHFTTPRRQQSFNFDNMRQESSVRGQINAMRRASRLQQLQNQFVRQQQPNQEFILQQPHGRRQVQHILVDRPPAHNQTQYILVKQQNPRQQFIRVRNNTIKNSTRFARRQKFRRQRQGQFTVNALYDPPNFLQRI